MVSSAEPDEKTYSWDDIPYSCGACGGTPYVCSICGYDVCGYGLNDGEANLCLMPGCGGIARGLCQRGAPVHWILTSSSWTRPSRPSTTPLSLPLSYTQAPPSGAGELHPG